MFTPKNRKEENKMDTVERPVPTENQKFCKFCGAIIDKDCVICPKCGKQVEELKSAQPNVVINNTNTNANVNTIRGYGRPKNKWVSFFLCLFFGMIGAHKFYEGKVGTGILYLFTLGLCGIGWVIDTITILLKPNPYYV
jgi:RNA polymerase subunit RPABC4/transcription elongation factor Spt4|nr:MAG TPA: TM2 domain [Caudoviricetes sp.]